MKTEKSFDVRPNIGKPHMRLALAAAMCAAALFAAPKQPAQSFATDVEAYLAAHKVAGVDSFQGLLKMMGEPCGTAASIDATVQPKHKAKKIRLWGITLLPVYKAWGLDVAEFDPEAAAQGDTTRVSFIADRPTHNYTLFQPERNDNAGFYFVCFAEAFNSDLKMMKGEKRDFHYVVEVSKK